MKKSYIAMGFTLALVAPIIGAAPVAAAPSSDRAYQGTVARIIDGDSIRVTGINREVRFIGSRSGRRGVLLPPVEGLRNGRAQGKAGDAAGRPPRQRDRPRRLFAYVYVDGKHYNLESVSEGYARERAYGSNYTLRPEFKAAQRKAERDDRGLWDACS